MTPAVLVPPIPDIFHTIPNLKEPREMSHLIAPNILRQYAARMSNSWKVARIVD